MDIKFTTLAWSRDSGYQSATETVVDNLEQWNNLWQLHTCNAEPSPLVPQVDFTRYSVAAVFAGEQPNSGYSVEILSVEARAEKEQPAIVITVQYRQPQPREFVIRELTYPNHIIKIPKIDRNNVTFRRA